MGLVLKLGILLAITWCGYAIPDDDVEPFFSDTDDIEYGLNGTDTNDTDVNETSIEMLFNETASSIEEPSTETAASKTGPTQPALTNDETTDLKSTEASSEPILTTFGSTSTVSNNLESNELKIKEAIFVKSEQDGETSTIEPKSSEIQTTLVTPTRTAININKAVKKAGFSTSKSVFEMENAPKSVCAIKKSKKLFMPIMKRKRKPTTPKAMITVRVALVEPETDVSQQRFVDHSFYKSALICNESYFDEFWTNITNGSDRIRLHPQVGNDDLRRENRDFTYDVKLPFEFPYYGHTLRNLTISTGGYIFTGPGTTVVFAEDQSISPLKADWDISLDEESAIVLYQGPDQFTVSWEDISIADKKDLKFSFAATLYRNGDIIFSYKDIPLKIQEIVERPNSVFVGIADSYYLNMASRYVGRKMINNYSRIPFNNYNIQSQSILKLIAQPSCPMYNTCKTCIGHETRHETFKCMWCEGLRRCSSGADYFRPYLADCHFTNVCNADDN